jgi:lipopolysaccharide export system protein LptC
MRSAWSDRIGSLLSLGLLAALGLSSWILSSMTQVPDWMRVGQKKTGPTAVVTKAHIVRTGADGKPHQTVVSPTIQQFEDGRALLTAPDLTSFTDNGPPIFAKARQAQVSPDQNQIVLKGAVVIRRQAFRDDPTLRIETETLTFLSNEQVAQTQDPVMVYRGASTLYGVGMRLDEKTDRLQILADTRMVLPKSKPEEKKP